MAEIRRFGPEIKTPLPRPGVKGVSVVAIQLPPHVANRFSPDELVERYKGKPFFLDQPMSVFAHYYEAYAEIDEHDAPIPVLFLVISGSGFVRIGGREAETVPVSAGDAVLWPANVTHKAWTQGEPMQALIIDCLHDGT